MKKEFQMAGEGRAGNPLPAGYSHGGGAHGVTRPTSAFTLIEVLVVMVLLSLIVLALMTVFNSTQMAFRASMTQADVLEGGRSVMDLMTADLKGMTPSGGTNSGAVNLFASDNSYFVVSSLAYTPMVQSLPAVSDPNTQRTNLLNYFFLLTRQNTEWIGVGYVVNPTNMSPPYPLYRYHAQTNTSQPPAGLFNGFINAVNNGQWTNMSHLIDGVVDLRLRTYDINGYQMINTNQYNSGQFTSYTNVTFHTNNFQREPVFFFYSNTIPASVEIEMATLEDRTLQHAESLPGGVPRDNYLKNQAGKVHVFRQRVSIPNVDPSAYR